MKRISIITTYYERPKELEKLLRSLQRALRNRPYDVTHYIIDDASQTKIGLAKVPVEKYELKNYRINCYENEENYGKERYWKTYNNIFHFASQRRADFVIFLPDDEVVCRRFFDRIFKLYDELPAGSMLQFLVDERILETFDTFPYEIIDGTCLVPAEYMRGLGWRILPTRPPYPSSKVWRQTTERILKKYPHASVRTPDYSVVRHLCPSKSKMHAEQRLRAPITSLRWIDNEPKSRRLRTIDKWRGLGPQEKRPGRYLLVVGGGFGNQVMAAGLYLQMQKFLERVDVAISNAYTCQTEFYDVLTRYCEAETFRADKVLPALYDGQVVASWATGVDGIPVIDHTTTDNVNEAQRNAELGMRQRWCSNTWNTNLFFCKEVLPIDWPLFRGSDMTAGRCYDVVLCNGSFNQFAWLKKRYMQWPRVVEILKAEGLRVLSVGTPPEFVYGADDGIKLSLMETLDAIARAKVFAGTCSGLSHYANAVGVDTFYFLSFTLKEKNVDEEGFHCFSRVYQEKVCRHQPGQTAQWVNKPECMNCADWICSYRPNPDSIAQEILNMYRSRQRRASD